MEDQGIYDVVVTTPRAPLALKPVMDIESMLSTRQGILQLLKRVMVHEVDYGQIPGTLRPTLYKFGAEKLARFFGLTVEPELVEAEERWSDGTTEAFFKYTYRARAMWGEQLIAQMDGMCHSHEDRFRWRWVPETDVPFYLDKSQLVAKIGAAWEFKFSIERAEVTGQYGKPAAHWQMFKEAIAQGTAKPIKKKTKAGKEYDAWEVDATVYRIPNPDIESEAHNIRMRAQKRAFVAVVSRATNAGDVFMVGETADEEGDPGRSDSPQAWMPVTSATGNSPQQDIDEVFGKNGLSPADEIRKAYGRLKAGKGVPPTDQRFAEFLDLLLGLKLDAEVTAQAIFNRPATGLDAAQVEALMANASAMEKA